MAGPRVAGDLVAGVVLTDRLRCRDPLRLGERRGIADDDCAVVAPHARERVLAAAVELDVRGRPATAIAEPRDAAIGADRAFG